LRNTPARHFIITVSNCTSSVSQRRSSSGYSSGGYSSLDGGVLIINADPGDYTLTASCVFDTVQPPLQPVGLSDQEQRNLEAFIMAFDSDLAPIVGQQTTLADTNLSEVQARIDLMIQRSGTVLPGGLPECDLVVKGVLNGEPRGWLRGGTLNSPTFVIDKQVAAGWSKTELLAVATVPGQALTFTCVPPGSGFRMGIDRDRDNIWDYDDPFPGFFNSPDWSIGRTTPAGSAGNVSFLMMLGVLARRLTMGRRRRRLR
jgi:hypothetical protein